MSPATGFRRDIQGLRAIAVLSVVAFHAGFTWLKGGFVGVDVFFVISGYLITKILGRENDAGTYSLMAFYRRRLRRIMPALLVMLALCLLAGGALLSPRDMRELGVTAVSTVLFLSNIEFLKLTDYFASASEYKPLLHTWSLAVEEQFYIFFPPCLALVWRFGRKRTLAVVCAAASVSLVCSIILGVKWPAGGFYLPITRAFELLIGSTIAIKSNIFGGFSSRIRDAISIIGGALLFGSLIVIDQTSMVFPGFVALFPCFGTALLIASGESGDTLVGRAISSAPFQFFGNLSYSLYLWHWPLLVFARHYKMAPLDAWTALVCVVVAICFAYASYRFVETPALKRFPRLPVIYLGLSSIAAVSAIGIAIVLTNGLEFRLSPLARAIANGSKDFNPDRSRCHGDGDRIWSYAETCVFGHGDAQVAVWGDSSGAELSPSLGKVLRGVSVREVTFSSCPPAVGFIQLGRPLCRTQNDAMMRGLSEDKRVKVVVLTANFENYGRDHYSEILSGVNESVRGLRSAGKEVVILGPIPNQEYDPPAALSIIAERGQDLNSWGRRRLNVEYYNGGPDRRLNQIALETGSRFFSPSSLFCDRDLCRAYDKERGVIYFNQTHLSMSGSLELSEAVRGLILDQLGK